MNFAKEREERELPQKIFEPLFRSGTLSTKGEDLELILGCLEGLSDVVGVIDVLLATGAWGRWKL